MSTTKFHIPPATHQAQGEASDPHNSVWVAANAGSGKTTVLARRVERLLLNGTDPSRILALTFTKAAAGEMAIRVFKTLGDWAVMPEDELREALSETEGKAPTSEQLNRARTLFARALETPGGLKIQTIHAFCEALLHQFPLEANIPGHFTVMNDGHQSLMMSEARRQVILHWASHKDSALGHAMGALVDATTETKVEKALAAVVKNRERISRWLDEAGTIPQAIAGLKAACGFSDNTTDESLITEGLSDLALDQLDLPAVILAWEKEGSKAATNGVAALQGLAEPETDPEGTMDKLTSWLITQKDELTSRALAGTMGQAAAGLDKEGLTEILHETVTQLLHIRARRQTLIQIDNTAHLLTVAQSLLARYQRDKRRAGMLDFDDLINRAADLLTRKDARAWVLYKLDRGIDHLLVDEAQDTSRRQWQIIRALVEEFFSGDGARDVERTVFVVGDEKQSIYSFQGADPEAFATQRRQIARLANDAGHQFKDVSLNLSFRSTADVLSAVDTVFANLENAKGVTDGKGDAMVHEAARIHKVGHVEIWDPFKADGSQVPDEWHVFAEDEAALPAVKLATTMADRIVEMIGGERLAATGKTITAGDILILVRSRDAFVGALNRALKERGVPTAGADRLALGDHIAVQDLLALGQVAVTPQDDLSLATVLKSPLFGLSEDDLYSLARHGLTPAPEDETRTKTEPALGERMVRSRSLFSSLRDLADHEPYTAAWQKLRTLQQRADAIPVYEFYALLLGMDGGRRQFRERLGPEVEDVLDAFLDLTLAHETANLPGLQAFVENLQADSPDIKRPMEQTADQVQLMTVHAAKGLEAKIVFLVDRHAGAWRTQNQPALYDVGDGHEMVWVRDGSDHGHITLPVQQRQIENAQEEYRRLLYVAMTRAEDQLIVCGYRPKNTPTGPIWHHMVSEALSETMEEIATLGIDDDGEEIKSYRWTIPDTKRGPVRQPPHHEAEAETTKEAVESLPGWLNHRLAPEPDLPRPLSPSGAQAIIEETLARPRRSVSVMEASTTAPSVSPRLLGNVVHRLFEELPNRPRHRWQELGSTYARAHLHTMANGEIDALLTSLFATLEDDQLASYLDPANSRAEVPITGTLSLHSGPRPVAGTIDRLAVLDDHIMLLDYKTGSRVPKTPADITPGYVTQMALYRHLVGNLYPNNSVRAALIYTAARNEQGQPAPRLLELEASAMDAALAKVMAL